MGMKWMKEHQSVLGNLKAERNFALGSLDRTQESSETQVACPVGIVFSHPFPRLSAQHVFLPT